MPNDMLDSFRRALRAEDKAILDKQAKLASMKPAQQRKAKIWISGARFGRSFLLAEVRRQRRLARNQY